MAEEKITITIDEDGVINAKTDGFYGETCMNALDEILGKDMQYASSKKTDDYYKKTTIKNKLTQKLGGGK